MRVDEATVPIVEAGDCKFWELSIEEHFLGQIKCTEDSSLILSTGAVDE